ncbi:mandelate racemase/muconate lactonizing enzyme family protein [Thalassotalea sp. HSM 43]|uniref:mandelate racemase/muconate lactonizing enzyme family protein n=1 Tax=Thalassotalea sp. HSM 43 TaxID=2552945 RepID=UPI001080F644|nr:mandelate racemase/muconate lactonizing enzyme family protein [Thalassotalea sp. HSM 43]QBY04219.1 mandelate racemase/muconate lactonizing enzyme family protein [Thalassotalea sp. HSM 43]
MKIAAIRSYHLRCSLQKPFGFSQWTYDQRNVLVIEVITDTGLSGWGECYGPADVTQAAVEHFYAPRIIGMHALSSEVIWQHMWRSSLDFARGGIMMGAMSGLDMALWDLKGKALNLSVSELMGGRQRQQIDCYATGMYFQDMNEQQLLSTLVAEAQAYACEGFKAMKIKIGKNLNFDKQLIKAMREALPNTTLMADSNHAYDLPEAISIGRVLDECQYHWFEEPLSPEHLRQFHSLHNKLDLAIATGECEQTRFGFDKLLTSGGVNIIQPDLAYCGGPSEALKIRAIASANGVNCIPHVWGTQLNLAAAVHFLATAYVEPGRAESQSLLLEYDRTENPLRDELYSTSIDIKHGVATVPDAAGLGVQIDPHTLEQFTIKRSETL